MSEKKVSLSDAINIAFEYFTKGQFSEAETICRQVLAVDRNQPDVWNLLGASLFSKGACAEAIESVEVAISLNKDDEQYHYSLGYFLYRCQRLAEARESLERSIQIAPDFHSANLALGCLFVDLKDIKSACKFLRRAVSLNATDVDSLFNLGVLLIRHGNLDEGIRYLGKVLAIDVRHPGARLALARQYLGSAPMESAEMLAINWDDSELNIGQQGDRFIYQAIHSWCQGETKACEGFLDKAGSMLMVDRGYVNGYNNKTYHRYISELINFRKESPGYYLEQDNSLYFVGDSHCLSAAGLNIRWKDGIAHGQARLIMGCKAWHLSMSDENGYKNQFEMVLKSIPEKSTVVITVGEIDCRPNEGIFPLCNGNCEDMLKIVRKTLDGFVSFVETIAVDNKVELVYYGVPCKNEVFPSQQKRSAHMEMLVAYNSYLGSLAESNGRTFIDVFSLSQNSDNVFVDSTHLRPDFLASMFYSLN